MPTTLFMKKICFFLLSIQLSVFASAQRLYGTVTNDKGELLPFTSILVKGTTKGTSSNNKANYSITVSPGEYTIVCSHIGYTTAEKTVSIKGDTKLDFVLTEQKLDLQEVVVKPGGEDPAYAIIRQAIKKRATYLKETDEFSCSFYSKDLMQLRSVPDKVLGKKIKTEDKKDMGVDSAGKGIIYLSENVAKVYNKQPNKLKMDIISSRVSGSNGFGFSFPAFISLYNSNVKVFADVFNPRGFVSPISDGAIGFYKFKFLGSFYENGKEINSIRVTPRRKYEPLFSGILNITEDDWRIHSFDLLLTKTSQLELLDTLSIRQQYMPVSDGKWMVKDQLLHFGIKMLGFDAFGNFLNVYSDYNLAPGYTKKFFDNVIIKYDTAVNKRPIAYWDSIRPVPLEPEEIKDYKIKDSTNKARLDSMKSKWTLDSLNKSQPKFKPLKWAIRENYYHRHYDSLGNYSWMVSSLLPNMEYNSVEGVVMNFGTAYNRSVYRRRLTISIEPTIRYGFSNGHLNAWAHLIFRSRDTASSASRTYTFSGGKRVSEFNKQSTIHPLINAISTLGYGKNYLKVYENYYGLFNYGVRKENGLRYFANLLFENRMPLENTSTFTFSKKNTVHITPNYPNERIPAQFIQHQAFIVTVGASYQPGQRFIQFPHYKSPIGSKYPVFSVEYTKGIKGIFGSDVDFDKWSFLVSGNKNFRLAGALRYKAGVGGFINNNAVPIQDYQHFNGNRMINAGEYVNSFQLAPYYANSTTAPFYVIGHAEHHFNGLFTNKIPLFRRLNWHLVAGSNAFFVNNKNNYAEIFIGLENIFKLFRVDAIAAYENGRRGLTGIRIGAGGILGGRVKINTSQRADKLKGNFTGM